MVSYAFAWTGHFLIEGNKPATFGHPFWSFISDFKMLGLMATGKLKARMEAGTKVKRRSRLTVPHKGEYKMGDAKAQVAETKNYLDPALLFTQDRRRLVERSSSLQV